MDGTPHIALDAPPARGRIAAAAVACILVAVLVACRAFEIGVPGEWTWRWNDAPLWDRAWLPACFFLLLLGVLLAGYAHRETMRPREEIVLVALVVVLAFAFQVSTVYLGKGAGQEVVFATLTPWVSGYFDAARHDVAGLRPFLARYPDYILSLPMKGSMIHVGQHPPGCVLFYWAQLQLFESSPALSDLMQRAGDALTFGGASAFDVWRGPALAGPERAVVWSSFFLLAGGCALAVAPVYLLARQWAGRAAGLLAAGLFATAPSVHLFSPHVDQLHVPLSAGVCGLWAWALHRRSKWLAVGTGLGLGLCLFMSLHFVALAALCVLAAAMLCGRDWRAAKRYAWLCAWLGVGVSAVILSSTSRSRTTCCACGGSA